MLIYHAPACWMLKVFQKGLQPLTVVIKRRRSLQFSMECQVPIIIWTVAAVQSADSLLTSCELCNMVIVSHQTDGRTFATVHPGSTALDVPGDRQAQETASFVAALA